MQKPAPTAIAADAVLAPGSGRAGIGALPPLTAPLRRALGWASRIGSIADQAASGAVTFLVILLIGRFIGADGLGLLPFAGAAWAAAITAGMVLAAMRRPEIVFASYLLAALVMVFAGSLLMAACGITGAIIGLLASWLTLATTQLAAAWWISGQRRADPADPGRKDR